MKVRTDNRETWGQERTNRVKRPSRTRELLRSKHNTEHHSTEVIPALDEGYVSGSKLNEPRTEASCFTPCC